MSLFTGWDNTQPEWPAMPSALFPELMVIGFIYAFYSPLLDLVKVGHTNRLVEKRRREIEREQPCGPLGLLGLRKGTTATEDMLWDHWKAAGHHVPVRRRDDSGKHIEWFRPATEILDYFSRCRMVQEA